jgi:hypothetical protein
MAPPSTGTAPPARRSHPRRWWRLWLVVGAVALLAAGTYVFEWSRPLRVTVRNGTPHPIDGLALVNGRGIRTPLARISPGGTAVVQPRVGPSEDHLSLVDSSGTPYVLLGYFEGNPGGEVTVTIDQVAPEGLVGRVLDRSRYAPAGEFGLVRATR